MSLSCSCDVGDSDTWWYIYPHGYSLLTTKTRRRCASCKQPINVGDTTVKFTRARNPRDDIEARIHGDEVSLAPWHMCEECGDLYFSLVELGFCIPLGQSMKELVEEYQEYKKAGI